MSLFSDYINAKVHTPAIGIKVGGAWQPNIVSCQWDRSFDQQSASCTIVFGSKLSFSPNNTTQVVVYEGYSDQVAPVFTGYVDTYKAGLFPNTWEMTCRDVLKRAEDIWIDDQGVTYTSTQAEAAVADLLSKAGISATCGTTSFTIGDTHPVTFKMVSVIDACNQIAALIGWRIWCSAAGTVYFQKRKPRQSNNPEWVYQYGVNVLKRNYSKTDRDARNRIVVLGYWDPANATPIRAAHYAPASYTDTYRTAILSSELIDTQPMADTIATWMLQDLNSLTYVYEFDCAGNPGIDSGRTISVYDSAEGIAANFFVYSIHSELDGNSGKFQYHVTAVRWDTSNDNYVEPNPVPVPPPPVPPPPTPPIPFPDGKGNLLYMLTNHGVTQCKNAYGTDGTDGDPTWKSIMHGTPVAGTGTASQVGQTVTGSGTAFLSEVHVGDLIYGAATGLHGMVTDVQDDTTLIVDTNEGYASTAFTISPILTNLTYNSLNVHLFNFDPYSLNDTKHAFERMWVVGDDGLFLCDGLPDAPTWEKKLSKTDIATLLGKSEDWVGYGYNFAPSVRLENFIAIPVFFYNDGTGWTAWYYAYSLDNGDTWNCSLDYSWNANEPGGLITVVDRTRPTVFSSFHVDNLHYLSGSFNSDQAGTPDPGVAYWRSQALPAFDRAASSGNVGHETDAGTTVFPYSDPTGTPYLDDNVLYEVNQIYRAGLQAIIRSESAFNPLWSHLYTPPTYDDVGDVSMQTFSSGAANGIRLAIDMKDEDNQVSFQKANRPSPDTTYPLWVTIDRAVTWTQLITDTNYLPVAGRQADVLLSLFLIPSDYTIFFAVADAMDGGLALPIMSTDWGQTFHDISKYGLEGAVDDVMALNAFPDSQIMIDYNYIGGTHVPTGAAGIDVSHYQGTINWATAKAAGIGFAFIKASEGTSSTDAKFAGNWSGAGAQSIERGPYHYFINNLDPTAQANHFYAVAASGGELGYAVDCEDEGSSLTPANLKTFLDRMETLTGQKCIIYTRASWWNSYVGAQSWTADYPLWVANWGVASPTLPTGWTDFVYWQYSASGTASIYGAEGTTIDLDQA